VRLFRRFIFWHCISLRVLTFSNPLPSIFLMIRIDDEIYAHFRREFPKLQVAKFDEQALKSESAKVAWRRFCNEYTGDRVKDFNFGSLVRLDSAGDYDEANSSFGSFFIRSWKSISRGSHVYDYFHAFFFSCIPSFICSALAALRIQFLAIEIARNREGCNVKVREQAKAAASAAAGGQ
jgi:hypothetical protein